MRVVNTRPSPQWSAGGSTLLSRPRVSSSDRQTVFVVDDDEVFRDSLAFLLRSVHLKTTCCGSVGEFLDVYRPGEPGCLVLDVRLPDLSGLSVQNSLSGRNVLLPVVLVSGFGDVRTAVAAMRNRAVDFLEKARGRPAPARCGAGCLGPRAEDAGESRVRQDSPEPIRSAEQPRAPGDGAGGGGAAEQTGRCGVGLSVKTVEEYRAKVLAKMEARDLPTLVRMAATVSRAG